MYVCAAWGIGECAVVQISTHTHFELVFDGRCVHCVLCTDYKVYACRRGYCLKLNFCRQLIVWLAVFFHSRLLLLSCAAKVLHPNSFVLPRRDMKARGMCAACTTTLCH